MTSPRVLTAIAVVSVILNFLLVGFFIGQRLPHFAGPRFGHEVMRDFPPDRGPPRPGERRERTRVLMGPNDLNFFAATRALDPEARKSVEARFREEMPEIRARVQTMIEKRRALLEVLAGEPTDMERLSQALNDVRAAGAAAQEHTHKFFLEIAAGLPEDQRAAFLKAAATRGRPPR